MDYFLLNEIEAGDICNEQGEGEALLRKLSAKFPGARIVLTLGGDGSLYWDGERLLKQGIYKVEVADTTAAGDTFTGFFIGGLVQGMDAAAALEWAAKAAAIAVSRQGAGSLSINAVPNESLITAIRLLSGAPGVDIWSMFLSPFTSSALTVSSSL